MTTLPQTAPMRMPRTVGPGAGVPALGPVHAGGPPAGAPGGTGGLQLTGADVWRILRANWWLILLVLVAAGVAGYFVNRYLNANYKRYTAIGLVSVKTDKEWIVGNEMVDVDPAGLAIEAKTQTRQMTHPSLLEDVLRNENSEIRETKWLREFEPFPNLEQAKEDLAARLDVTPIPDSRLIQVQFTYKEPADCKTILMELVDKHIEDQRVVARERWKQRYESLKNAREAGNRERKKLKDEMTLKSRELARMGASPRSSGTLDYEVVRLTDTISAAEREMIDAQSILDGLRNTLNEGKFPTEAYDYLERNARFQQYNGYIDEAEIALSIMDPSSTATKNMVRNQKLKELYEQKREEVKEEIRQSVADRLMSEAAGKAQSAKLMHTVVTKRRNDVQTQLGKVLSLQSDYDERGEEERVLRERLDEIQKNIDEIELQRLPAEWSYIEWANRPLTPEIPSFPRLKYTMAVALALGLALGLGVAFLREVTDTSVRSPRDIARVGQMTLLGMVPHEADDPQAAGARLPLVIFDAPQSSTAEEFRRLRTRLQHTASLDTNRSLLVSSANPQDGKTIVATNLAAGLALNGRRILLVDANFRRPQLHQIFGAANEQGFGDVLNSPEAFEANVHETQVPNLYVMPAGPKPANATELLESQLLIDFIERALEEYDHVIFDSGPLLMASETMALAPRVDGVVTVARARSNTRGVLTRMRDELRRVKAEHLGVVLNAVRAQGGGYYGRNIKSYYAYQNG